MPSFELETSNKRHVRRKAKQHWILQRVGYLLFNQLYCNLFILFLGSLQIFVKPNMAPTITVNVDVTDTGLMLKRKTYFKTKTPTSIQRLRQ